MRVILGTTKDTPTETWPTRQKLEQVKSYFSAVEILHNPLLESHKRHKGMQTGTGQVLKGSSRGLNTASMAADTAQANQRVGKVPKQIPASPRNTSARQLGKALSRIASRQNRVRDQASHSRKQQTARPHNVHWWLSQQRPVRVRLHCQARCDYHPWRPAVQPIWSQPPAWQWTRKQSPMPSAGLSSSSQIQWACYKVKSGRYPPSKNPVGVLPWTCRSERKWPSR